MSHIHKVPREKPVTYQKQRACEIMAYVGHVYLSKGQCVAPKTSPTARTWCVQVARDELERTTGVG